MTYIQVGTKEYRRASLALFMGGFVTFATLYTTQPLLPVFAKEFHVSAPAASLTLSLTTGVLAISLLIAGSLSDAIGKKRMMVFSMLFTSIIGVLTSYSPNFITLITCRALLGVCIAGIPSIAMAYIGEEFHPKGIGNIMGLYIGGTGIGGMAGRILTGVLTDLFSWRIALLAVGVISLLASILFWLTIPTPQNTVKSKLNLREAWDAYKMHVMNKGLLSLIVMGFLLMGSFVTLYNYIGFLLIEPPYQLSQTILGFIFVVYVFGTFSSVYMGKKADQYGYAHMAKISLGIMIGGAIITLLPLLFEKIIGIILFTIGFFSSHSIISSWIGDSAKVHKAQASSLYLFFYYLGSSLIGSFGGYFWVHYHWLGVVSLLSGLLLLGYPLILAAVKEQQCNFLEKPAGKLKRKV